MKSLQKLEIAGFLLGEIEALLNHLHFYKCKNILANIDALEYYLKLLDEENSSQFFEIIKDTKIATVNDTINLKYFLGESWIEMIWESEAQNYFVNKENKSKIQSILLATKGLILLSANEFCHASSTRMRINKWNWEKNFKKTNQQKKNVLAS